MILSLLLLISAVYLQCNFSPNTTITYSEAIECLETIPVCFYRYALLTFSKGHTR